MTRSLLALAGLALLACSGEADDKTDTNETTPTDTGKPTGETGTPPVAEIQLEVDVSGLLGEGLVLQNDGGDDLAIDEDGTHAFATAVAVGDPYAVTVLIQPGMPPQRCAVTNGEGTATARTAAVRVVCETYHLAFATSSTGSGDLAGWKDAGGAQGLAAGDAVCRAHAARAGLPGTFVAWLSDDTDDAYCRAAGFSGKKEANCGESALPADAGPWVRPDGLPFARALDRMVWPHHEVILPPALDESGADLGDVYFASATTAEGEASRVAPCGNWTNEDPDSEITGGSTTSSDLAHWGGDWCDQTFRLLCLQVGAGLQLPDAPEPPVDAHLLFVTSTPVDGMQGGATGADPLCTSLANAAGYVGSFEAWLTDGTTDAEARMDHAGPWVRPDGLVIAETTKDLIAGDLMAPPNQTETGAFTTEYVWTGITWGGEPATDNCDDWSTADSTVAGARGLPYVNHTGWSAWGTFACDGPLHLYCYAD